MILFTQTYNHYEPSLGLYKPCFFVSSYETYNVEYLQPINYFLRDNFENFFKYHLNLTIDGKEIDTFSQYCFTIFNPKLPYNLLFIYLLSCFLTLSSPKSSFRFDRTIWLLSMILNIANYKHLLDILSTNKNEPTIADLNKLLSLNLATILLPLIQITMITRLLLKMYEKVFETSVKNDTNKRTVKNTNFNMINFNTISPSPFNMKRSISDETLNNFDQKSNFSTSPDLNNNNTAKSVIRPARFLPKNVSKSVFQFRTLENGATSENYDSNNQFF
jgi:hypothetical protein